MLVVVRRLWGQVSDGPSGVEDQSKTRQSARISPGPSKSGSVAAVRRVGVVPVIDVEIPLPSPHPCIPITERRHRAAHCVSRGTYAPFHEFGSIVGRRKALEHSLAPARPSVHGSCNTHRQTNERRHGEET